MLHLISVILAVLGISAGMILCLDDAAQPDKERKWGIFLFGGSAAAFIVIVLYG